MTAKVGNPLFRDMPTTVFEVMSQLALKHKSINLGQGFPDDRGPPDVLQAAADALLNGYNQYPSMMGTPELRQALRYRPNTSLYRAAGRMRYVETRLDGKEGKRRTYHLVAVDDTEYLQSVATTLPASQPI